MSALYRGSLVHARRDHLRRTFRYPVFMAAIDLEDLHHIDRDLRLFSFDRPNLFSLYAKDYTTAIAPRATTTTTTTTLVTNLRFAGYAFNPVSFFLHYEDDQLASVVAEVNNNYGGRHCYVLDDERRIALDDGRVGFRTTRDFFVSPFLHGPRIYEWWFPARRDPALLAITMHVATPTGDRIFTATFAGERRAMTDLALAGAALRYPLNTVQVIGLIHYEALKLRYLYNEPYRRPGPDHQPLDLRAPCDE